MRIVHIVQLELFILNDGFVELVEVCLGLETLEPVDDGVIYQFV